jgi:hypothetical protein
MAAINPNPKYLKALLTAVPGSELADDDGRTPVHYAAACTGTGPLEYLIKIGADITVADVKGITPLMIAAQLGRVENIKLLLNPHMEEVHFRELVNDKDVHKHISAVLNQTMKWRQPTEEDEALAAAQEPKNTATPMETDPPLSEETIEEITEGLLGHQLLAKYLKAPSEEEEGGGEGEEKDKTEEEGEEGESEKKPKAEQTIPYVDAMNTSGCTALWFAAEAGHADCVQLLIEKTASVNVHEKGAKLTPLAVACMKGHLEVVKVLLDNGAFIEKPDKLKRTPLIHAVRNGFAHITSYLISRFD